MQARSRSEVPWLIAGLAALAVAITIAIDLLTYKLVGYDLAAYILAARRLQAGASLYGTEPTALGPFGQFVYPPPVAIPFVLLADLPFDGARLIMLLSLVSLAIWVTWWIVRSIRPPARYWAAAAIVLFFPLLWEVGLGNLTLVSLGLCLMAWSSRDRSARAGTLFGLALGLKLLPLTLVAFFGVARRTGVLAAALVTLALVGIVTWPVVGREWPPFIGLLAALITAAPGTGPNVVPTLFSTPLLRPVLPGLALLIAMLAGGVARSPVREDHAFRVALAAVPLFFSTLWYPYLIFALPLLFGPPPDGRLPRAAVWGVRMWAWLLMQAQLMGEPGRAFTLPFVGLLVLLGAGVIELAPYRRPATLSARGWRRLPVRRPDRTA